MKRASRLAKGKAMLEVRSGEGLIFLDLARDEYSCCYDPERPTLDYVDLIAPARSIGLDHAHSVQTSCWTDPLQSDFPTSSLFNVFRFMSALAKAGIRLRGRSVADLASVAGRLGSGRRHDTVTAQQASNLFRYYLALTPFRPRCLFNSFALLHFLDCYGLRADWVFGAQLFPFRAHCWLASDGMLLNELRHRIEDYEVVWTAGQALQ
jgi:hypothetical protein